MEIDSYYINIGSTIQLTGVQYIEVRGMGVIHKPRSQNFGYFDPGSPSPSWSLLLNKAYVIKWSFG